MAPSRNQIIVGAGAVLLGAVIFAGILTAGGPGGHYHYSAQRNITGSAEGDLTNYQIGFGQHWENLNNSTGTNTDHVTFTNEHSLPDWNDIRINMTINGTDVLIPIDFYLDVDNQTATSIGLFYKMPLIAQNGSCGRVIYYGYASATSASNGSATFYFWEPMDSITSWTGNSTWQKNEPAGSSVTISGGKAIINMTNTGNSACSMSTRFNMTGDATGSLNRAIFTRASMVYGARNTSGAGHAKPLHFRRFHIQPTDL